jgi:GNAT superfamily N-acetyltransferase
VLSEQRPTRRLVKFTVPISADDLKALPDHTSLIKDLADKPNIVTVLPRFVGTGDTGRFVTAFFIFHGSEATRVTLYTRIRTSDGKSTLEKRDEITLGYEPKIIGDLWDQTIVIKEDDIRPVEHLRQRCEYDTYWLVSGYDPGITYEEYKREPFPTNTKGLPDCDHTKADDPVKTPNLDLVVTPCGDCGIPLLTTTGPDPIEAWTTLTADYLGLPTTGDPPVHGKRTTPAGPLTNAEVTLHVLSRFANVEQSHFEIYARNDRYGYLVAIGDAIIGYALWNTFEGTVALQQIYVFPEFRGDNLAELLVDVWFDQLDADHYYAIGPNDAGLTTLSQAGHLDDGTATPATILSCRDSINPGEVNASYTDQIRRGDDPLEP